MIKGHEECGNVAGKRYAAASGNKERNGEVDTPEVDHQPDEEKRQRHVQEHRQRGYKRVDPPILDPSAVNHVPEYPSLVRGSLSA